VEGDGRVAVLEGGREEAVRDVLVGHAAHAADDLWPGEAMVRGHLRRLMGVDVGLQVREKEAAQVRDAREALRGDRLKQEGDPVGAEAGGRGGQVEDGDCVRAEVAPALEREDLQREVEWAWHDAAGTVWQGRGALMGRGLTPPWPPNKFKRVCEKG
jgi:hypothetical protein